MSGFEFSVSGGAQFLATNEIPFRSACSFFVLPGALLQQVDDGLIEAVAHVEAVACARDVADDDVNAGCGGTHGDRGRGLELAETVLAGGALPLALGEAGILVRSL